MIDGNTSKRPQNGEETTCKMHSCRRFETPMPHCAITLASDHGNSELP